MSDASTKKMLRAYFEESMNPMRFMSGFFQTPRENFFSSESVEFDVVREDESVAIAISGLSEGYNWNDTDIYTNKEFTPPVLSEASALNAYDLLKRAAGETPYELSRSVGFQAKAQLEAQMKFRRMEAKIRRNVELQCSQVMQTGKLDLVNNDGNTVFGMDFKPKTSHFPTAATPWDNAASDPMGDINTLAELIRDDSLNDPDLLVMGGRAYDAFIKHASVKDLLDNRRIDQGGIVPMVMRGNGGSYRGTIEIQNYRYQIWTYNGKYDDPETGNKTSYLDPKKVIVMASGARKDLVFGAVPIIKRSDAMPNLPTRLASTRAGMDLYTNAWYSTDGRQLMVSAGARPLAIPTAIDSYCCIDTDLA